MKIVMVDPSLFTGRYDDSLCAALAQRGHDVTLLGRPLRATDAIMPQGYRYVPRFFRHGEGLRARLGEGRRGRAAKALDYAFDAAFGSLKAFDGDVVHFQWLPFARADARLLARLRKRVALVHTVHNATAYHGDGRGTAQGHGYDALLPLFDALIVHGEGTADALVAQGIVPNRIHIIAHPPMRLAEAGPDDLATVPRASVPRILFFGTIRPYKGLDLLIEAALSLWQAGAAFELVIAGKPFMDVEPLLARVTAAGFADRLVTDLGFQTEQRLDAHLRRADIIAFPYRDIDSSGAFLSALRYGAAMVTSDAGMFGELDEEAVTRFPAGDATALADGLRPLIADVALREARGDAAWALGEAMGGWERAARRTVRAYDAAIAEFAAREGAA